MFKTRGLNVKKQIYNSWLSIDNEQNLTSMIQGQWTK